MLARLVFGAVLAALVGVASAQECPAGNLLAGLRPLPGTLILEPERLTDGTVVTEGYAWDNNASSVVVRGPGPVFDLGRNVAVHAALLQADHAATYQLSGSLDGRNWFAVWRTQPGSGRGVHMRSTSSLQTAVRWLRVAAPHPDSAYAISELQVYCRVPEHWPPLLEVQGGRPDRSVRSSGVRHGSIIKLHRLTLALLGFVVLFAFARARNDPRQEGARIVGAIAVAGSAVVTAYLAYAATFHPSVPERWLHWAVLLAGAGLPQALLVADLAQRSTARGLSAVGGALAGIVALGYSVAVALLYDVQSVAITLVVAAIGLLALADAVRSRPGRRSWPDRVQRPVLIALAVAGAYGLANFGVSSYSGLVAGAGAQAVFNRSSPPRVAMHDQFHYFLGAKYFRELGYELLYHCTAIAEEDNGRGAQIREMRVRDLRTNRLRWGWEVLAEPEVCRARFSPHRWSTFRADVAYFRTSVSAYASGKMVVDHGYNASPFWTAVHAPLLAQLPASDETLLRLSLIDIALLAGMFALLWWGFSLEVAVLATVLSGSCELWAYGSLSGIGNFGRLYWIFGVVAAVCLMRKRQFMLGGAALALAVLDRVFPGALLFGPGIAAASGLLRRRFDERLWRTLGGALAGLVLLSGLGYVVGGGIEDYGAFVRNSSKHVATPLTNYVGLPTLVASSAATLSRSIIQEGHLDPYVGWKRVRTETAQERRPWYWASVVLLFAFTGWVCLRLAEPWRLVIAGVLPLLCLFDLTNYYYVVLIVLAPLAAGNPRHLMVLFGMVFAAGLTAQHANHLVTYPLYSAIALCLLLYFLAVLARDSPASDALPDAKTSARW